MKIILQIRIHISVCKDCNSSFSAYSYTWVSFGLSYFFLDFLSQVFVGITELTFKTSEICKAVDENYIARGRW